MLMELDKTVYINTMDFLNFRTSFRSLSVKAENCFFLCDYCFGRFTSIFFVRMVRTYKFKKNGKNTKNTSFIGRNMVVMSNNYELLANVSRIQNFLTVSNIFQNDHHLRKIRKNITYDTTI